MGYQRFKLRRFKAGTAARPSAFFRYAFLCDYVGPSPSGEFSMLFARGYRPMALMSFRLSLAGIRPLSLEGASPHGGLQGPAPMLTALRYFVDRSNCKGTKDILAVPFLENKRKRDYYGAIFACKYKAFSLFTRFNHF